MSSKLSPNIFKKISFRLTFGFIILFFFSSLSVLFLNYFLFSRSLETRDHENLYAKAKEYSSIFSKENIEDFKKYIVERKQSDADSQFLIRVVSSNQETAYLHIPESMSRWTSKEVEDKILSLHLNNKIHKFTLKERSEEDPDEENVYEITEVATSGGYQIQIARNTDEREDLLERYIGTILLASVIVLLIAAMGGYFFSNQALAPLRTLIEAIKRVRSGQLSVRVPIRHSNDELDEISILFNKMAERIEKLIFNMQETLDTVAHELRTPLTRLKSRSELALLSAPSEENYRAALVNNIDNTTQIVSLINSIMDISEAEVGLLKLNLVDIKSNEILSEIVDLYSIVAEEKNIKINFVENVMFNFTGDKNRFKQVISNLIDNSIKYSQEKTQINVETYRENNFYKISISDQGLGISEQDLPKIWERLFRTNPHHTEKGLGLGLSLVRSICKAHGWNIEVQSTLDVGSTFTLTIKANPTA